MIGIVIDGRLGNQMFQYAVVYNYSKKLRTKFFVHNKLWTFPFILSEYFILPGYFRYFNTIKTKLYNGILNSKFQHIDLRGNIDDPSVIIPKIKDYTYFNGYFQSYEYFKEYRDEIVRSYKLKKKCRLKFESKYKELFNNNKIIAIHLRRTDYKDLGGKEHGGTDMSLPIEYYKRCIGNIKNIDNYKLLFVSDDLDYARENFGEKSNYFYEKNEEIVDFQILLNSDIAITANSSFSWWAAYLNSKQNKIIYTPKYWFGFKVQKEIPPSIIPKDWIQIDVTLNSEGKQTGFSQ